MASNNSGGDQTAARPGGSSKAKKGSRKGDSLNFNHDNGGGDKQGGKK